MGSLSTEMTPSAAMAPAGLLGYSFMGPSWDRWRAVLAAAWAEPMTAEQITLFREVADRDPPMHRVRELWCLAGRRAGKDSTASAVATVAALGDYTAILRPGERATILCLASTKDQAKLVFKYIKAYFDEIPLLHPLVERDTDESLELTNGAEIIVSTNSFRSVRGRSIVCVILDEVAYYRSEDSASPDTELYNALEPAMSTFGDRAIMIGISSPYRRAGLLFNKWKESYGKPDPDVLVVRGASRVFNPSLPQRVVDARLARDPEAGAAEYLAEWRNDLSDFLDRELVENAVDAGVKVRPPSLRREYRAFTDSAGGRGDAFTAAIAHDEGGVSVIDCLYERRAPFNPSEVVHEVANLLREYGLSRVCGDRYAAGWTTEAFASEGIAYDDSERDRSSIYLDVLPLFTSGRIRLLDNPRLVHQFVSLERRETKFGKSRVDHPAYGGSDDLCNSAAGAAVLVATDHRPALIKRKDLASDAAPAEHPMALLFFATVWVGIDGMGAYVIFSYHPHYAPKLIVVDFDFLPWSPMILPEVANRLDEACEANQTKPRQIMQHAPSATMHVPQQLLRPAQDAMRLAFSSRLGRHDIRFRKIDVKSLMTGQLADPAQMILNASAHVGTGAVKLSATAIERSETIPLLGILGLAPGELVQNNALRVAFLFGVGQLDDARSQPQGAKISFG